MQSHTCLTFDNICYPLPQVHVVQLKLGKDEAAQRYHAALATAAAGLETTDTEEVTGVSLTGLHLPAEVQHSQGNNQD